MVDCTPAEGALQQTLIRPHFSIGRPKVVASLAIVAIALDLRLARGIAAQAKHDRQMSRFGNMNFVSWQSCA